jgi:hypothetical protein
VGKGTHVTEGKRNIRAACIVVFWIDIFGFCLWTEAGQGWMNAISLRRVGKLSEEV